ncbi:hypothetical protein Tco_1178569, partial [Tanacetum coccineum]
MSLLSELRRRFIGPLNAWLEFDICEYSLEIKKAFHTTYKELTKKEIEKPKSLSFVDYGNIRNGRALQELDEFCREPMIHEYVLEFLSTVSFRDHVMDLDVNDTIVFQLG